MAAVVTRKRVCFTYLVKTSNVCAPAWMFTVVVNQDGTIGVQDIKSPYGPLCNTGIQIPEEVLQAIEDAKDEVEDILANTSVLNGTLTFTDQTSQSIIFADPFNNTNYRVYVSLPDFLSYRIVNKTVTGFDIELGVTFTGTVGYDVFI